MTAHPPGPPRRDGRLRRGDHSRRAVLDLAVQRASREGLESLSIGGLAAALETSKSGLFSLFGSKEALQLATVARARELFLAAVIEPARAAPRGLRRLEAVAESWLAYSRTGVFEGGCFFVAARTEFDAREGAVREAVLAVIEQWLGYLEHQAAIAVEAGELPPGTDPAQLAFEMDAVFAAADGARILFHDPRAQQRARTALARLLSAG